MELQYILKAIDAAFLAGEQIRRVYDDPDADFQVERKADNSPLTIADKRAHAVIADVLSATPFPVLSEEGKHISYAERASWKELWVVDPLDGTKEFIKRNGEFTVNIAWICQGVPVVGVIYVPVKKELYLGIEKFGAFKLSDVIRAFTFYTGNGSFHRTPETTSFESGAFVQWKFVENLPCCRGESGCLSAFCSYDGVGYGSRACHCTGCRRRNLANGFEKTSLL